MKSLSPGFKIFYLFMGLFVIYLIYEGSRKKRKKDSPVAPVTGGSSGTASGSGTSNSGTSGSGSTSTNQPKGGGLNLDLWLKKGMSGAEVRELQKMLDEAIKHFNSKGYRINSVRIDGKFGQKTEDALYNIIGYVETSLRRYKERGFRKDKFPNGWNSYKGSTGGSGGSANVPRGDGVVYW